MKEEEIRPKAIFNEYLALAQKDAQTYFSQSKREHILCPACQAEGNEAFEKEGFHYQECPECKTLYVSPRPEKAAFERYYSDSPSTKYWATTFYKSTSEARRQKLWQPKAKEIKEIIECYAPKTQQIIDIGGGYGIFCEEIEKVMPISTLVIEPSLHLSQVCREKNINVIQKFIEDITTEDIETKHNCFVSFELFEHLHDPQKFLQTIFHIMKPGDIFIFTTLSGLGPDIQSLWQDSKSVFPPHHLNFFNPKSLRLTLQRLDFKVMDIFTPGKLDLDIMLNSRDKVKDRFWRNFLDLADPDEKIQMQNFLAKNGLSSHMWAICQRP